MACGGGEGERGVEGISDCHRGKLVLRVIKRQTCNLRLPYKIPNVTALTKFAESTTHLFSSCLMSWKNLGFICENYTRADLFPGSLHRFQGQTTQILADFTRILRLKTGKGFYSRRLCSFHRPLLSKCNQTQSHL